MGDDATEANGNGNGNGWTGKAKAAGTFINQVGIPSLIILFVLWYLGMVMVGRAEWPIVTKKQFTDAQTQNMELHTAIIENARANTKAVEKSTNVLQRLDCEHKPSKDEKLDCFRDIN